MEMAGLHKGRAAMRGMEDNEELLRLQEEMMGRQSKLAAKVTRIQRPSAPEPPKEPPAAATETSAPAKALHMAGILAAMSEIVGEVKERQPSAAEAAPPQPLQPLRQPGGVAEDGAGAIMAAFPAAVHRKQSKFALGRKKQQPQQGAAEAAGTTQPAAMPATANVSPTAQAGQRVSFTADAKGGAAAGGVREGHEEEGGDAASIDAENRQLLAAMSAQQIEEARSEVLSRLRPSALEFLKRRAANKAAATARPAAATSEAAPGSAVHRELAGQATLAAATPEPPAAARTTSTHNATSSRAQQPPAPGAGRYNGPNSKGPPGEQQPAQQGGVELGGGNAASALAGCLRFDVRGQVVGLKPSIDIAGGAAGGQAEVVRRDPLRQDEGVAGEGYTIEEACLLARSSLAQQRVLALRLLAAVLHASRPGVRSSTHSTTRWVPVPEALLEFEAAGAIAADANAGRASIKSGAAAAAGPRLAGPGPRPAPLDWADVWMHALHAADVAVVLRLALDDTNLAVIGAAAEALVALVGPSEEEEAASELADANPLTGWPAIPLRHMQRPSATGGWVAVPARPKPQQNGESDENEEEGASLDERQLSKVDPLLGLLHMGLLPRLAFVLGQARAPGAIGPLICLLIRCCMAGKDVADQVASCPGMCAALQQILDSTPPGPNADAADAACYAARPRALRLLRQLAQASKFCARTLLETGQTRHIVTEVLRAPPSSPAGEEADAQDFAPPAAAAVAAVAASTSSCMAFLGAKLEALRAWRAFALHGLYLLHLDDAFPAICRLFVPSLLPAPAAATPRVSQKPLPAPYGGTAATSLGSGHRQQSGKARGEGGEDKGADALTGIDPQQWAAAREAYLALAYLCTHTVSCAPHEAMLSGKAASALAQQARDWLLALPLEQLLGGCCQWLAGQARQAARPLTDPVGEELGAGRGPSHRHPGLFPALTLPRPPATPAGASAPAVHAVLSTLGAVLHFLAAFSAVPEWQEGGELAEACRALERTGLLVPAPAAAAAPTAAALGSPAVPGTQGLASEGQEQARAAQPAEPTADGEGIPRQGCMLFISEMLQLALLQQQQHAGGQGGSTSAPPSAAATAAGAAATNLAVALGRLEAALLQPGRGAAGGGGSKSHPAATAAAALEPLLTRPAAANLLAACSPAGGFDRTMLQPWGGVRWQAVAQLARAATVGISLAGPAGGGCGCTAATAAEVAAAVLCVLPPGDDSSALLALTELVSDQGAICSSGLAAAAAALEQLEGSTMGQVAGGTPTEQGSPTYPRSAVPPAKQLSQQLLAGYAAEWLGFERESNAELGEGSRARGLPAISTAAVLHPEGSRLPLLGDWPLREVAIPPPASGLPAGSVVAAGASLLLALALEELGVQSMAQCSPGEKLRATVLLVFAPHAELEGAQQAQHMPGGGGGDSSSAEQEELWRDPLVRWCTAALLSRYCSQGSSNEGSSGSASKAAQGQLPVGRGSSSDDSSSNGSIGDSGAGWRLPEAQVLAGQFAAVSFGDPLFGVAVAVLLRQGVPLDIQLEVVQVLAGEQALHLLPPLSSLPGLPAAYLDPLPAIPASSSSGGCTGASLGPQLGPERKEAEAFVRLVVEGQLDKCLQPAETPLALAVPLVVHRLAWHLFGAAGSRKAQPAGEGDAARLGQSVDGQEGRGWRDAALLCLLRACCGSSASAPEAPGRATLLRMLLCWDCGSCAQEEAGRVAGGLARERARIALAVVRANADAELEQRVQELLAGLLG